MSNNHALEDLDLSLACDPATLTLVGSAVRRRLDSTPGVERVPVDEADVYVVDRFMTRRDCRAIVEVINQRAAPSTLYRGTEREDFRTSFTHHFDRNDPLTRDIEEYLAELTGIDPIYAEVIQGQRYSVGQQFKAHHDFFHVGEGYWLTEAVRGGQRTWTAMLYLNEPREGGETSFPLLGLNFSPKAGTLLVWNNIDASGKPNMKTLHAGTPVKRGIKHVITQWYRQDPWRILNPGDYATG